MEFKLLKSRSQLIGESLKQLQTSSTDIEGSVVVSVDGLSFASSLSQEVEEDKVSAMSAAMLSLGERITQELGRGTVEQVYIKGEEGFVLVKFIGDEAVLTVLARRQSKLGMLFWVMRRACESLSKMI